MNRREESESGDRRRRRMFACCEVEDERARAWNKARRVAERVDIAAVAAVETTRLRELAVHAVEQEACLEQERSCD